MSIEKLLQENTAALVALTAQLKATPVMTLPATTPAGSKVKAADAKPAETKPKETPPPAAAPEIPAELTYAVLADKVTAAIKVHTKVTVLEALKAELPNGKLADVKDTPKAWADIVAKLDAIPAPEAK